MKKTLTILFMLTGMIQLFAQPVLQSNNLQLGDEFTISVVTNVSRTGLETEGPNVNWSLSGGTITPAGTVLFTSPANTPYGSTYPEANFAIRIILGADTVVHLFKKSAAGFEEVATDLGTGFSADIFTSYRTFMPDTMNYGDSIVDGYQKQGGSASVAALVYDAWGSLATNDTTYTNLGRIFRVDTQGDTNVVWWAQGGRLPVMMYDGSDLFLWKLKPSTPTGVAMVEQSTKVSVYPNPSEGVFKLGNLNGRKAQVEVFDLSGKRVYSASSVDEIDLSALDNGLYVLKLAVDGLVEVNRIHKQ